MLTEEGIGYVNNFRDKHWRDILMFDKTIRVRHGIRYTGNRKGMEIHTSSRKLRIKFKTMHDLYDWLESLIDCICNCPYIKKTRFDSFSPIKQLSRAKWYINGIDYYKDLADELEKAKHEIYITDWWLSPEVYLKRPVPVKEDGTLDTYWRLDEILKRRSEAGVRIFCLVYREFEQALPNKSVYTQEVLSKIKNVEVVRHPGSAISFWSHHEKSCNIDQRICFMGGLDLCYGRFDMDTYPLYDPGDEKNIWFPGQDYSNVRLKDFTNVDQYDRTLIDRKSNPRMPWRDIAVSIEGEVVKDISRHFIQYWNFAKSDIEGAKKNRKLLHKKDYKIKKKIMEHHMSRSRRTINHQLQEMGRRDNQASEVFPISEINNRITLSMSYGNDMVAKNNARKKFLSYEQDKEDDEEEDRIGPKSKEPKTRVMCRKEMIPNPKATKKTDFSILTTEKDGEAKEELIKPCAQDKGKYLYLVDENMKEECAKDLKEINKKNDKQNASYQIPDIFFRQIPQEKDKETPGEISKKKMLYPCECQVRFFLKKDFEELRAMVNGLTSRSYRNIYIKCLY